MKIDEIRIYAECLEQGLDFKDYLLEIDRDLFIKNIYLPKFRGEPRDNDSQLLRILKLKSFDLAISIISNNSEIPILLIEYSTAVPTDDHKMQRSDVYFWSGIFKIPVMKISPFNKNSFNEHGGGDKINNQGEVALALNNNAVVYFINFGYQNNTLLTNKERLSCIDKTTEIGKVLSVLIKEFLQHKNFDIVYKNLLHSFECVIDKNLAPLKNVFTNSTRFKREGNDIIVKINRFGHAMDPDRGILFFINMLFGNDYTITKFTIERKNKESYKTLFDTLSKTKLNQINSLIEQGVSAHRVLKIFMIATGINIRLEEVAPAHFQIKDDEFLRFLRTYGNNVYKSIFLNSKELRLCNLDNAIICRISWSPSVATLYKDSLREKAHREPLLIVPLDSKNIKEDIITLASVEVFKRIGCEILATSYPGAQADRAILIGSGRKMKRIYIDIIASKTKEDNFYVFLHENKDKSSKIKEDIQKLQNIKNNHISELNVLLKKLNKSSFDTLFLGIGFKYSCEIINKIEDIDYIFAFDLNTNNDNTNILFSVAVVNLDLIDFFGALKNSQRKLQGTIVLDKVYRINKLHCDVQKYP
ncbi:hypothetical protein NHP190003_16310 (plasmid) [Helicobacter sp. NHP19-003]|uniref:Uncharacterized protein n=1 Tax=Helicobacter gastrocanis TaxID=2849641 RepID=A0ABN6I6X2_9HELI|nr:hypothetical protein [Helicobacter sp. NHP19-003]BCZ18349.1 hypothetical protein NHP190003_16310 [Helicobacter sp. NHP19-003]